MSCARRLPNPTKRLRTRWCHRSPKNIQPCTDRPWPCSFWLWKPRAPARVTPPYQCTSAFRGRGPLTDGETSSRTYQAPVTTQRRSLLIRLNKFSTRQTHKAQPQDIPQTISDRSGDSVHSRRRVSSFTANLEYNHVEGVRRGSDVPRLRCLWILCLYTLDYVHVFRDLQTAVRREHP